MLVVQIIGSRSVNSLSFESGLNVVVAFFTHCVFYAATSGWLLLCNSKLLIDCAHVCLCVCAVELD